MPFNNFPFVRYVLFFFVGVYLYGYSSALPHYFWLGSLCLLFGAYCGLVVFGHRYNWGYVEYCIPLLAYGILILAGIAFSHLNDPKRNPVHLLHQERFEGYLAKVLESDQPKARSSANRLEVLAVHRRGEFLPAAGKVLIYHQNLQALTPGSLLYVPGMPQEIPEPDNPGEFDYRTYSARQKVFHRHFVRGQMVPLQSRANLTPRQYMGVLREELAGRLEELMDDRKAYQVAKALLLGEKQSMDEDIKEAFSTAGTMHVLAVSGLHVGIVYGFFFLFWKPRRMKPVPRMLFLSLVVAVIWCYALITGMSPSVLRAATMFSLMALAQMISRSPSIFNPLALSALILVMYDPAIVYALGFQLSYAALLGILLFQPVIGSWWTPPNKIIDYFWQIASVSLAAQLGTLPITVHFFHTFPTYFLFANLAAIPAAFGIMVIGLPVLVLSSFPSVSAWLAVVLETITVFFNTLVFFTQQLPMAKVDFLYMDTFQMILTWVATVLFFWWMRAKEIVSFRLLAAAVFLFGFYRFWIFGAQRLEDDVTVYRLSKGVAVDWYYQGTLYSYSEGVDDSDFAYKIFPNRVRKGVRQEVTLLSSIIANQVLLVGPDRERYWLDASNFTLTKVSDPLLAEAADQKAGVSSNWELAD